MKKRMDAMKKRDLVAFGAISVVGFGLAASPAHAVDSWNLQQFEQIQTITSGQGYAIGFARNIGTVTQSDIMVNGGRGVGLKFSNTNVFGSSEALGIAASVIGQSSVNVISAQNINNFAGTLTTTVR
jgi:hypothetical protein